MRGDSAFAVVLRSRSILLVKARRKDRWQLPGGRLHRGETPEDAVLRELEEETGLRGRLLAVAGVHPRRDGSLVHLFRIGVDRGAHPAGPRHEIEAQAWVPIRNAASWVSRSTLRRLRGRRRQAWALRTARARPPRRRPPPA